MKRERRGAERTENKYADVLKLKHRKKNEYGFELSTDVTKKKKILWLSIIAAITLISYYPAFDNEITSWDDEFYLNDNPYLKELSAESIATLFDAKTYYMGNYHPLSMVSLSIDYAIGGEDESGNINPFMFHFTNIILHLLISLLVFWFVLILLRNFNIAVIVGLMFGVHTLHVESVAWISERKDVLYALFFVASLIFYVKYIDEKKGVYYILALLLFILSLFSKGQAVSLAVTIIAIDFLRERKDNIQKLIAEKIPFIGLALIFGIIAISAQSESEALVDEQGYSFVQRIAIGSYAFMQYVYKLVIPINLSAIYPYPDIIKQTIPPMYYLMILPVGFIGALFFWLVKKSKKVLAFAFAFFIINIFLLLQFIPVGSAVHADRYAYIPSIGFYILVAVLLIRLTERENKNKRLILGITGIYIAILGAMSFQRCDVWQNSETLWDDTINKSPNSVIAMNNRGSLKDKKAAKAMDEFRFEEAKQFRYSAIIDFTKAIEGKPDYKNAFYNRGVSRIELGKLLKDTTMIELSVIDFNKALEQESQFPDAYHQRANAKAELGLFESAIKDFNLAIDLKPADYNYFTNRGVTKGKMGDIKGAIEDFNNALAINPDESAIYSNRGKAKMLIKDVIGAIEDYDMALKINPNHATAFFNRALAKNSIKDNEGAIDDLSKAIQINPDIKDAYYWRAVFYLELNNRESACPDLQKALDMGIQHAGVLLQQYCL